MTPDDEKAREEEPMPTWVIVFLSLAIYGLGAVILYLTTIDRKIEFAFGDYYGYVIPEKILPRLGIPAGWILWTTWLVYRHRRWRRVREDREAQPDATHNT